jgi:hypothetical protein
MTYPTVYFNAMGEAVSDFKRQPKMRSALWALGASTILMTVLPSVLDTLRQNATPEDLEDDEAVLFGLQRLFATFFQAFGLPGQAASTAVLGITPGVGITNSFFRDGARLANAISDMVEEGEITSENAAKLVKPAATVFRLPLGSQFERARKAAEEGSENPFDYVLGPPPK